jgi:hypothetical protein
MATARAKCITLYTRDTRWLEQLARVGVVEARIQQQEGSLHTSLAAQRNLQDAERTAMLVGNSFEPVALVHESNQARIVGDALNASRVECAIAQAACNPVMVFANPFWLRRSATASPV